MRRIDDRPLHERIAANLRAKILSGEVVELPPFVDLADEYDTSVNTMQRAVQLLKDEGIIEASRGRRMTIRTAMHIVDATPYLDPATTRYSYRILEVGVVKPPADVVRALGLDPLSQPTAVLRKRLTIRDGEDPVEIVWSYYPAELADSPLGRRGRIPGGAPAALAELGYVQDAQEDIVTEREPTTEELETLELPAGMHVLRTLRTITDANGRPIEVSVMVKGGHLYGLRYRQKLVPDA